MNDIPYVEIRKSLVIPSLSDELFAEAARVIQSLQPAAAKNNTGPEATTQRRLKGQTRAMLTKFQSLEKSLSKLPEESKQRKAVVQQMEMEARMFRQELNRVRLKFTLPHPPTALDRWKRKVPYLDKFLKRKGAVIPGVPGSFVPYSPIDPDKTPKRQRTGPQPLKDDARGATWKKEF